MDRVLILHGWGGSDFPHWQSHLAAEIAKDYGTVSFPLLKEKDAPKKEIWFLQVKEILEEFRPHTVVCHSLANTLWFHLCNDGRIRKVKNLFLVAPPSLTCKIPNISTFFPVEIPKDIHAKNAALITSTNDPYMDAAEAENLAKELDIEHTVLQDAGHISTDSGYGVWEEIVKRVKQQGK
jgi:uncharacterized protein